jgi:hypothetical protein
MELGEPDGRGSADSWFLYESIENRGGLHWAVAGAGGSAVGAGPIGNWDVSRQLIVKFSAAGTVSDVSLKRKECSLWGGTADLGLTQLKGDCPDPRGSDFIRELSLADGEAKAFAAIGAIVSRYDTLLYAESKPQTCDFPAFDQERSGESFIVGEHAVIWQDSLTKVWSTLSLESIEEVRPLERHYLNWRIPIKRRDGSCMFVTVVKGRSVAKGLQEEARAAIQTRIGAVKMTPPALPAAGESVLSKSGVE